MKIMRLEQATTRLQANNHLLNTRLEDTNNMIEELRRKNELMEMGLAKEKKKSSEFEAIRLAAESGSANKRQVRSRRKKSSAAAAMSSIRRDGSRQGKGGGGRSSKSGRKGKGTGKGGRPRMESQIEIEDNVSDADNESIEEEAEEEEELDGRDQEVPREGSRDMELGVNRLDDSGVAADTHSTDVMLAEQRLQEIKDKDTEIFNMKRENATLSSKIHWLEERLKNSTESSNLATETLNELNGKYKLQCKKLNQREKEVERLKSVIEEERNEKQMEMGMMKEELEAQRIREVEALQNELNAFLSDRTQLSKDEVTKLMKGRAEMEKELRREKLEKRKEAQVLLHQQVKLKKQVSLLNQDLKDNDRMWSKKFNALQHSYHAIREEYHLRETLRRQFKATQKLDLVRNGSSNMSKSVIQNPPIIATSNTGSLTLLNSAHSGVSSVDEVYSGDVKRFMKTNNLTAANNSGMVDDYSDEELHAEYSYLSLIREVAEPSDVSSRGAARSEQKPRDPGGPRSNNQDRMRFENGDDVEGLPSGGAMGVVSLVESSYVTGATCSTDAFKMDANLEQVVTEESVLDTAESVNVSDDE